MKIVIQMIIFAIIFIGIYGSMHYAVLSNVFKLYDISKNRYFFLTLALLTISLPLAMMIERTWPSGLSRVFYILAATWLGVVFLLLVFTGIYRLINLFVPITSPITGTIMLSLVGILTVMSIFFAQTVSVRQIEIPIEGLDKELTIAQLTDLHIGTINQESFLQKVVDRTNSLKPDVIVITGDLIDGSAPLDDKEIAPINSLNGDVFYVIGNHEIYDGLDNVMKIISKTKLQPLRNKQKTFNGVRFLGIDYAESRSQLKRELSKQNLSKSKPIILLYHSPSMKADELAKYGISLQIAGHTHAGQIFPFSLLSWLGNSYLMGLHYSQDKKTAVYVSPGTGTWGPPMRLGSRSEITLIRLVPK